MFQKNKLKIISTISIWAIFLFLIILSFLSMDFIYVFIFLFFLLFLLHTSVKLSSIFRPYSKVKYKNFTDFKPFVSIHVACKSEPAELVIDTIKAMQKIDYPNYEVILINSNSTDYKNWIKMKNYFDKLGTNYKFIHLDKISGFKAGALNYLIGHTDKRAAVIAIVDCDYVVDKDFLNNTVGYFKNKKVGIVQAPQDYYNSNKYNEGLLYEYRTFFATIMHQCQRNNLVTFTGTMGLIRAELLRKKLKWNEWCITEDVEAGTYINSIGYDGVYVDEKLGKGLMPYDYISMSKQRQRWTYGNMQVIKKDLKSIIKNEKLTKQQKFSFFALMAVWFHFELILSSLYLLTTTISIFVPSNKEFGIISSIFLYIILLSVLCNLLFFILGLRRDCSIEKRIKAFITHYGFLYTMSISWITCLLGKKLGFIVTKKEYSNQDTPISTHWREFIIPVLIISGLIISVLTNSLAITDLVIASSFVVVDITSIIYTNRLFNKSRIKFV